MSKEEILNSYPDPQPGDFLYAVWGYDQTNASFWKVLKRTPHQVTLVEVQTEFWSDEDGRESTRLAPSQIPKQNHDQPACALPAISYDSSGTERNEWRDYHDYPRESHACMVDRVLRRKVQPTGYVRISSFMGAHVYEGGGVYDTIAAGEPGH